MTTYQKGSGTENKFADWVSAFRRRASLVGWISSGVFAVFLIAAFTWPATYTSTGTILIEQQELPADIVRSTISSFADQRIQQISQRVMTTENLSKTIQKYDLYAKERKTRTREYVMALMREDTAFRLISANVIDPRTGLPSKATIAFSVSYSNESPALASKVANELVSLYMEQNIENRKTRTADATSFLSDESARLDKEILDQQKVLSAFKEKHLNDLPEKAQLNVQMLERANQELRDIDARVSSLDQQVVYLDSQLVQISPASVVYTSTGERVYSPEDRLKFLRTELARLTGTYGSDHPDVKRMQREVAGLEAAASSQDSVNDLQRQLTSLRTQLASARQKYSDEHPDVQRLQRSIATVESQLQAAAVNPVDAVANSAGQKNPDNPAYIQIKAQRESAIVERSTLLNKRSELKKEMDDVERRIANGPSVEREYSNLLRDLEGTQLKYREVRQKKLEAEVSQNLEAERKGERLTLIEPPLTPQSPASPNRIAILVIGLLLAVAIPLVVVIALESLDTSVRNRRDLELLLSVPPLAVIPWIENEAEVLRAKQLRINRIKGALIGFVVLLILTHFFYRPLDILWQNAIRKLTE